MNHQPSIVISIGIGMNVQSGMSPNIGMVQIPIPCIGIGQYWYESVCIGIGMDV